MAGKYKGLRTKTPRTPRSLAEEKGTSPSGFDGEVEYDAQAGAPLGASGAGARYEDAAKSALPSEGAAKRSDKIGPNPIK